MITVNVDTSDCFSHLDKIQAGLEVEVQRSLNYWAERSLIIARELTPVWTGNLKESSVIIAKNRVGLPTLGSGSFEEGKIVKSDGTNLALAHSMEIAATQAEVNAESNPNGVMMYTAYYASMKESQYHFFDAAENNFKGQVANVAAASLATYLRGI